jgi:hypothetical protein
MQIKWMDKEQAYPIVSLCLSIGLIGSLLMMGLYIIAAILGGIGAIYGVAAYASIAAMTAMAKRMYKRIYMNDKIPLYHYIILLILSCVFIELWSGYPINIILICLILVGCACSFIARRRT